MLDKPKKRRIPRDIGFSLNRVIPNLITLGALCLGISGIRFAIEGRFDMAVGAVLLATVLDALDGRMARLLKVSSEFGAQLDSLSDSIAFGVAPGIILYLGVLHMDRHLGWAVSLLVAVCCCMRLARFNVLLGRLPPYAYNYFQGVPAPMGGVLVLLPLILGFGYDIVVIDYLYIVLLWTVLVSLLMVSRVATFSFKRMKISYRWGAFIVFVIILCVAIFFTNPWKMVSVVSIFYVLSIPFSAFSYRRLRLEAGRLRSSSDRV